jgi:hypothetical protein
MTEKMNDALPDNQNLLCPSARCKAGAILLGVVQPDGHLAFLKNLLVVDEQFVQIARQGRTPERRFRFSDVCIQGACKQWTEDRCSVMDQVLQYVEPGELQSSELPPCPVRPRCRWHHQLGNTACSVCPVVITDLTVSDGI